MRREWNAPFGTIELSKVFTVNILSCVFMSWLYFYFYFHKIPPRVFMRLHFHSPYPAALMILRPSLLAMNSIRALAA